MKKVENKKQDPRIEYDKDHDKKRLRKLKRQVKFGGKASAEQENIHFSRPGDRPSLRVRDLESCVKKQ